MNALADVLRPLLLRASRRLKQVGTQEITPLDATLLALIGRRPGILGSELADLEQMTRASMSVHVKRLERAGMVVRRHPHANDRRRIGLELTAAGRTTMTELSRARTDWLVRRLQAIAPEDRATLRLALPALTALVDDR